MLIPPAILDSLPSPCLVVDRPTVVRNIAAMSSSLEGTSVRLRPHFKAHKCTTVMRMQLDAGNCVGVTCATAREALVLAESGFDDILLAHEVADPRNLELLMEAARRARLTVAVDSSAHVAILERSARAAGVALEIVIDIDPGMHRTGLQPGDQAVVAIAREVVQSVGLTYRGVFAYQGHLQMRADAEERWALEQESARLTALARDALTADGLPPSIVTGGGTGTYRMSVEAGVLNEIQAGSYVFMDATYEKDADLPFRVALYVLATVVSRPAADRAVVNAGLKATSVEKGMPRAVGLAATVQKLSDEHGTMLLTGSDQPQVGDRVLLVPSHIDPTINLHDVLFAWDPDRGLEHWPIDGRLRNS